MAVGFTRTGSLDTRARERNRGSYEEQPRASSRGVFTWLSKNISANVIYFYRKTRPAEAHSVSSGSQRSRVNAPSLSFVGKKSRRAGSKVCRPSRGENGGGRKGKDSNSFRFLCKLLGHPAGFLHANKSVLREP